MNDISSQTSGAVVCSVSSAPAHAFSKCVRGEILLVAGLGVEGDAHAGVTVRHRSRVARDPSQPNLRQVHLLQAELLDTLAAQGFALSPADLGENILTRGVALTKLSTDARLMIGQTVIRITGLRNPCGQIEAFRPGLLARVLERLPDGQILRKAGVMGIVERGGRISPGDQIIIKEPRGPARPLEPV